jgi:16S rRNA G966 N2-methylase RsmD
MIMFFDNYPDFIENDLRSKRQFMIINSETLTKRLEAILPKELCEGKRILDLGSALGAMGHMALINGAVSYTGVEIQEHYLNKSKELFEKYHPRGNWEFFKTIDEVQGEYDIVVAAGFIHGFFDVFDILKKTCAFAKERVIIETNEPKDNVYAAIFFDDGRMVNNDGQTERYRDYSGIKVTPNKPAIDLIMKTHGFDFVKRIYPEAFSTDYDTFNTSEAISTNVKRFILSYKKSNSALQTLETIIVNDNMEI